MHRLLVAALTCLVTSGLAYGGHRYLTNRAFAAWAGTPVAVIAVYECKNYLGALVISGDGQVHEAPDGVPAELVERLGAAVEKALGKGHSIVIRTCDTTHQST